MKRTGAQISTPPKRFKQEFVGPKRRITPRRIDSKFTGYTSTAASELKYVDLAEFTSTGSTTSTITLLNGIAQGTDNTNRIGRSFKVQSVHVRGIVYPEDGGTAPNLARLMVIWDSDPNGTTPVITDILTASTSTAHMNINNSKRFKVLANEQFAIGAFNNTAGSAVAGSPTVAHFDRFIKLPGVVTENLGTGATVASIQQGAIWLVTLGSQAAGNGSLFQLATRVRYTDP